MFFDRYCKTRLGQNEKLCTKKDKSPTVGLEPTTTRLRALRSTNWARRASWSSLLPNNHCNDVSKVGYNYNSDSGSKMGLSAKLITWVIGGAGRAKLLSLKLSNWIVRVAAPSHCKWVRKWNSTRLSYTFHFITLSVFSFFPSPRVWWNAWVSLRFLFLSYTGFDYSAPKPNAVVSPIQCAWEFNHETSTTSSFLNFETSQTKAMFQSIQISPRTALEHR